MVNTFKRQCICIYLLFGLGNMDLEERSFVKEEMAAP